MRFLKVTAIAVCLMLGFAMLASAQESSGMQGQTSAPSANAPKQRPSPPGTATCSFADGKAINVAYSRPSMRGRKIMGGLVPYGKVWRTGANEATSFETQAALTVAGKQIPAGKYTLYTLPGEDSWTLIINKQTGQWGTQYDEAQDLARIKMDVKKLDAPVDQFTISFDKSGQPSCRMKLEWENTSASVDLQEAK